MKNTKRCKQGGKEQIQSGFSGFGLATFFSRSSPRASSSLQPSLQATFFGHRGMRAAAGHKAL
jgi:hypothetical protein